MLSGHVVVSSSEAQRMLRSHWLSAGVLCISFFSAVSNQNAFSIRAQSPDTTSPIQLVPRTKAQREQKYEAEHHISLIVQVTDSSGKPVTGLKAEDFSLLDNQKPQKIQRFREVDGKTFTADVRVLVVLDGLNDNGSAIGHVQRDLDKFLSEGRGPLPFPLSVVSLSSEGATETQPSTDRAAIVRRLAEFARRPRGLDCDAVDPDLSLPSPWMFFPGVAQNNQNKSARQSCVLDHFHESINLLGTLMGEKQNSRERTILIWTGPGWRLPNLVPGEYPPVLAAMNTYLREDQTTLDAVSWGDFNRAPNLRKGIMSVTAVAPQSADQAAAAGMWLQVLAQQNGGQAFAKVKNFGEAMSKFMDDAREFYVLSFDSTPAAAADEFHTIEVKVDRPGVNVRTAAGYYAQP